MAPVSIEAPRHLAIAHRTTVPVFTNGSGDYKEAFAGPKTYRQDRELKGSGKHPPAKYPKYLPTWDAEKRSVAHLCKMGVVRAYLQLAILLSNVLSTTSMEKTLIPVSPIFSRMLKLKTSPEISVRR